MNISPLKYPEKILTTLFVVIGVLGICLDFFDIAEGTGSWINEFAFSWALIFIGCCLLSVLLLFFGVSVIWHDQTYVKSVEKTMVFRETIGLWRWLFAFIVFIFPIWLFQFTVLGIVFQGFFIRLSIWAVVLFLVSFLTTEKDSFISWRNFLTVLLLTASAFSIFASLRTVSSYPFSLGWSEGNRLWDYSIMFGRGRYDYPPSQKIFVLLETGRQFVGGIPFLIPGITIKAVRTWIALLEIFPYILLGLVLFRSMSKEKGLWLVLSLWAYLFLRQGPIHPPLIISAILVAMAWRRSFWISIPLIILSGYFTYISRYTWVFAPAIWLVLLELSDAVPDWNGKLKRTIWFKVVVLFSFGLLGGLFLPEFVKLLQTGSFIGVDFSSLIQGSKVSPESLQRAVSSQPLLWYRLMPNSTYRLGILLGSFLATGPLVFLLYYFSRKKQWGVNIWQKLSVFLPLLAFLAVGLVVSAKIGGGGDLHNMDMFFIGLLFSMAVAWHHGGREWLEIAHMEPVLIRMVIVAALMIPALTPLQDMRSYAFIEKASWLVALTDAPNERSLDMYPTQAVVGDSVNLIQSEVGKSSIKGEVLFIDQRQLLTFGFINGVRLVPDYDKKVLIERALSSNFEYFKNFYEDLRSHRFSLIITQPLNTPKKGSNNQFGEENNAWVNWVADPLLCFYEIHQTLLDVNVQLLVPRSKAVDCSRQLP